MSDVPGMQVFFKVVIDKDRYLGVFMSCEGIGCEVVVEPREEGGNNLFVHQLPVRLKYTNIKLTRPFDKDSALIAKWFGSMGGTISRFTAEITAMTPDNHPLASWQLFGVIPVRWQGPSFNVDSAKVATETLELAHHGFVFEKAA